MNPSRLGLVPEMLKTLLLLNSFKIIQDNLVTLSWLKLHQHPTDILALDLLSHILKMNHIENKSASLYTTEIHVSKVVLLQINFD